jgi:hypothetical protein
MSPPGQHRDHGIERGAGAERTAALLAGHAGRTGLRRTRGLDAALVEPERRVAVGHQRHINQQPVTPPIDSNKHEQWALLWLPLLLFPALLTFLVVGELFWWE